MTLKRLEILLPLNYNDGRPIEEKKFLTTHRELVERTDAPAAAGGKTLWIAGAIAAGTLLALVAR